MTTAKAPELRHRSAAATTSPTALELLRRRVALCRLFRDQVVACGEALARDDLEALERGLACREALIVEIHGVDEGLRAAGPPSGSERVESTLLLHEMRALLSESQLLDRQLIPDLSKRSDAAGRALDGLRTAHQTRSAYRREVGVRRAQPAPTILDTRG